MYKEKGREAQGFPEKCGGQEPSGQVHSSLQGGSKQQQAICFANALATGLQNKMLWALVESIWNVLTFKHLPQVSWI